jgi:flavin-dependent dehydrogenase
MSKNIAIIGGGTAGWISAIFARHYLNDEFQITVFEPSQIGIIGAGEGSTSLFKHFLESGMLGINEADFIKETGATFKLGIKHKDWPEIGRSYFGPLDDIRQAIRPLPTNSSFNYFANEVISRGEKLGDNTLNGQLMSTNKFSKPDSIKNFLTYSYHFDGHLVGKYFKKCCIAHGVKSVDDQVVDIEQDNTGNIKTLILKDNEKFPVDFVIDSSGFAKVIANKLGIKWIDYQEYLPVNSALPFLLDYKSDDLPNYTLAHALSAGWMWQIPKQDKLGCGYVFCDKYINFEQAQSEVESVLGHSITPIKQIKFNSGRSEKFLHKNYLIVGLAAAFLEPLEATSIHSTIDQLKIFFEEYSSTFDQSVDHYKYNQYVGDMYDTFRDFLTVHYRTKRTDKFWKDRWKDKTSDQVDYLLKIVKHKIPRDLDFISFSRSVNSVLYLSVLDGLDLLDADIAKEELRFYRALDYASVSLNSTKDVWSKIIPLFDTHRSYINSFK